MNNTEDYSQKLWEVYESLSNLFPDTTWSIGWDEHNTVRVTLGFNFPSPFTNKIENIEGQYFFESPDELTVVTTDVLGAYFLKSTVKEYITTLKELKEKEDKNE